MPMYRVKFDLTEIYSGAVDVEADNFEEAADIVFAMDPDDLMDFSSDGCASIDILNSEHDPISATTTPSRTPHLRLVTDKDTITNEN